MSLELEKTHSADAQCDTAPQTGTNSVRGREYTPGSDNWFNLELQSGALEIANNEKIDHWLRMVFLARARRDEHGHAGFAEGELGRFFATLDRGTGEMKPKHKNNVERSILRAIEMGFLDPISGSRCLVIPQRHMVSGPPKRYRPVCERNHRIRSKRSTSPSDVPSTPPPDVLCDKSTSGGDGRQAADLRKRKRPSYDYLGNCVAGSSLDLDAALCANDNDSDTARSLATASPSLPRSGAAAARAIGSLHSLDTAVPHCVSFSAEEGRCEHKDIAEMEALTYGRHRSKRTPPEMRRDY